MITDLQQATKIPKNRFFNSPMLTPITFVTKDRRVNADYQIETDNEGYIPEPPRKKGKNKGVHPMTPPTP